jgi:hypothetical protein
MSFFNDECDLVDDDQFDLFTLSTQVERRRKHTKQPAGTTAAEPMRRNDPDCSSIKQ